MYLHTFTVFQTSLSLTLSEHNPELLTVPVKYHILVLLADACYQDQNYKRSEVRYKMNICLL